MRQVSSARGCEGCVYSVIDRYRVFESTVFSVRNQIGGNMMDKKECVDRMREQMEKALGYLRSQLTTIRAGKANPAMLAGVLVDYYGTPTPIDQVANISSQDARSITIQPWEKSLIPAIEKAIQNANLGFNPQNNGETVRVPVPPLTEERRKELVKQARQEGEAAKVTIRNARRDANDVIKKLQKDGLAEDEAKNSEAEIQKITEQYNGKVESETAAKEKEIMTV